MASDWLHAYVDETGTNDLDTSKAGVSAYFICVAVVVEAERVEALTLELDRIAQRLCSGAEIKSSVIGGNHRRREQFLEAISGLDFGYYAMIIRKEAVWKDSGLQYKRSFYKCINQMLYRRLTRSSRKIRIIADEIGGRDFMDSFEGYLKRELKPDLFFEYDHQFSESRQTRLIQLADLIAGTLSYCYEPEKQGEHRGRYRQLLAAKEQGIDAWPPASIPKEANESHPTAAEDSLRPHLMARILRFISEKEHSQDPNERMQVSVLRSLLFAREFEQPSQQLISSDRLMQQLMDQGFEVTSKQAFTKNVIGGTRMDGVIIAGTRSGYRLALSGADIRDYLDHNKSIIEPMLARLWEARRAVKQDTANDVDIVSNPPYQILGKLVDCLSEQQLRLEEVES